MEILLEIIKIVVPAAIVFATAYYLVKNFLTSEHRKRLSEIRMGNQNIITPLRLQAYERVIIFLERISPNSLVTRVYKGGMSARVMHIELLRNVKDEYEHNLSQQIYVSVPAWELVKNAKEEIIKLINISSTKIPDTGSGSDLSQRIIEISGQVQKLPTQVAIDYIKREVGQTF